LFFSSIVYIFIVSHLIANELQYQEEKKKKKEKKLSGFKVPSKSSGITQEKKTLSKNQSRSTLPAASREGRKKKT
jgi:capsid portal protein